MVAAWRPRFRTAAAASSAWGSVPGDWIVMKLLKLAVWSVFLLLVAATWVHASEADLAIPELKVNVFFDDTVSAWWLLLCGALVICGTLSISLYLRTQIHRLPAHKSMLNVAETIFQTCKTYLLQQGKFLIALFSIIAVAITFYLFYS